jgi:hypothetical protein
MNTKLILILTLLLSSCVNSESSENPKQEIENLQENENNSIEGNNKIRNKQVVEDQDETSPAATIMLGTWYGEMNGKKLTIVINKVNGETLSGFNILGTNKRNLKGRFQIGTWDQPCSKAYDVTLNEPGDDKWDGVFTLKFVGYSNTIERGEGLECEGSYSGAEASGVWKANNGKLVHDFYLEKK